MVSRTQYAGAALLLRLELADRLEVDADAGQDGRDSGHDADLIEDAQTQVVGRLPRLGRQNLGLLAVNAHDGGVAFARRHVDGAGRVDEVAEHRRGGRAGAGAGAVVERRAGRLGVDEDGVHGAADLSQHAGLGHQRRVDAELDALGAPGAAVPPLRLGHMLDAVAELAGKTYIVDLDPFDALSRNPAGAEGGAEGEGREQGELVTAVAAIDVEARVGLGVTHLLGLSQGLGQGGAAVLHGAEDVVAGAVDDAGDPVDAIAGKAVVEGPHYGNGAGDGGLEENRRLPAGGGGENLLAALGQQGLVGRDHRLVLPDGGQHQGAGRFDAAHEFDDDVDVAVGDDDLGVGADVDRIAGCRSFLVGVSDRRLQNAQGVAVALFDFSAAAGEGVGDAAADDSEADETEVKGGSGTAVDRIHQKAGSEEEDGRCNSNQETAASGSQQQWRGEMAKRGPFCRAASMTASPAADGGGQGRANGYIICTRAAFAPRPAHLCVCSERFRFCPRF